MGPRADHDQIGGLLRCDPGEQLGPVAVGLAPFDGVLESP